MGDCGEAGSNGLHKDETLYLKIGAMAGILIASALGVAIPLVGSKFRFLKVDGKSFLGFKAFSAGVILATGFVHILGEASERLSSECLREMPWHKFPWTGFVAMLAVIVTLVVDALGTEYYERKNGVSFVQGHCHAVPNVAASTRVTSDKRSRDVENVLNSVKQEENTQHLRHIVISQVLELGIITHSVIIGISVGVSDLPSTIKPLFVALVFHQLFEGIALGGCIAQAGYKKVAALLMAFFFALTTPFGIALGLGIQSGYNENSQTSLIVQGLLDAVAAGILIYMSLVNLIATDFLGNRMKGDRLLQFFCYMSLFVGALAMSALAIWA